METLTSLARSWLTNAAIPERYGDERGAAVIGQLVHELEEALESVREECLTLFEAAQESGYSTDHLRHS